jgi:membrane protein DedA with SNARE-associated domain
VLTVPGSAAWCFGLAGAGWALGAHWQDFHDRFHYVDYVVLAAVVVGLAYLVYRRRMARLARRARAADTAR